VKITFTTIAAAAAIEAAGELASAAASLRHLARLDPGGAAAAGRVRADGA
jgi:hypothetical protein